MRKRIAATALALCTLSNPAWADETAADPSRLWLASGFLSRHDSDGGAPEGGWNETNGGIGLEYAFNGNWRLAAGVYENSMYETSRYAQLVWSPDRTTWRVRGCTFTLGAAVGTVDGYPGMREGRFFPTLLPVASVAWRRIGINLTYIPSLAGNVAGAMALQAKFRFF